MSRTLSDFPDLSHAEQMLLEHLQSGSRKTCEISPSVPTENAPEEHKIRATFLRYLALGGCDACRLPETGLQVMGAYIVGDDELGGDTRGLDLEGATLPGDLALIHCRIPDLILLRSARLKSLFLNGAHLDAGIEADGMQAEGVVVLRGAEVAGTVRLLGARLGGDLDCDGAKLTGTGQVLHCDGMQAEGGVVLSGAEVAGEVRLLGARLGGDLDCDGAKLTGKGDVLNAYGAVIDGALFLRGGARVSGALDLRAAHLGVICDDPECWPSELLLDRCRYRAFLGRSPVDADSRLRWLALQKPEDYGQDFWPDSYEHCAKVLREAGHGAEARTILIEKERLQRKARRTELWSSGRRFRVPVLWLRDLVLGATVRYGRQPLLAFLWLAAFLALGWVAFDQTARAGQIKPNMPLLQRAPEWIGCAEWGDRRRGDHPSQLDCFLDQPEAASYLRFDPFIYSADTLFPVVSLEMQSYWIPDDTQPIGWFARVYLWIHIALGWGLTLLAVAGFSGLIKTDNSS